MMCRWAQELLGYHFTCVHCSARMMIDVDGLTRRFGSVLSQHLCIAAVLHNVNMKKKHLAYEVDISKSDNITKLEAATDMISQSIPVLSVSDISSHVTAPAELLTGTTIWPPIFSTVPPIISSVPILLCHTPPENKLLHIEGDRELSSKIVQIANSCICSWLCIDDVCGSFQSWSNFGDSGSVGWDIVNLFTTHDTSLLFKILHKTLVQLSWDQWGQ